MTAPEVEWTLDQLSSVVGSLTVPLKRVNRDESRILEDNIRSRSGELQSANFVGVKLAERDTTPIGTEPQLDVEATVSVRVEGLHHSEYGYIDDTGQDGIPWSTQTEQGLVDRIRAAILQGLKFPDAGSTRTTYRSVLEVDNRDRSSGSGDYYRRDLSYRFNGTEDLP